MFRSLALLPFVAFVAHTIEWPRLAFDFTDLDIDLTMDEVVEQLDAGDYL